MPSCIFCGQSKVSKEHLWGAWWREYYPPSDKDMLARNKHTITTLESNNLLGTERGQFSNVGAPISATTKVVCEECNNTWMSQIEQGMKTTFRKYYITLENYIDPESVTRLQRWMYLKFCLLDRSYEIQNTLIPDSHPDKDRIEKIIRTKRTARWRDFCGGENIPDKYRFFIARSDDPYQLGSFNHIPMLLLRQEPDLDVHLVDTCMYFNGHFLGLITNHKKLADHLGNVNGNHDSTESLTELSMEYPEMRNESVVQGSVFEETVLSELETDRVRRYRRNFDLDTTA